MIDPKKLDEAKRALIDTNVLIFALDGGIKHPDHKLARALVEALAERKSRILVAAPTFAEFEVRKTGKSMPTGGVIEVVPFNHDAAKYLAERLPLNALKELGYVSTGTPNGKSCLKYDSMIVACAGRHLAQCIISTDTEHMPKLAAQAGLRCLSPRYFEQAQQSLALPPTSPKLA